MCMWGGGGVLRVNHTDSNRVYGTHCNCDCVLQKNNQYRVVIWPHAKWIFYQPVHKCFIPVIPQESANSVRFFFFFK